MERNTESRLQAAAENVTTRCTLMDFRIRIALFTPLLPALLFADASALPGDRDPTFTQSTFAGGESIAVSANGTVWTGASENLGHFSAEGAALQTWRLLDGPEQERGLVEVAKIIIQPDGRVLVGGRWHALQNKATGETFSQARLARFNADGSFDTGFRPNVGADGPITSMALRPDGRIVVSRFFPFVDDKSDLKAVQQFSSNGSLDNAFSVTRFDGDAYSIAVDNEGRILVGGWFRKVAGRANDGLVRLLTGGAIDPSFATPFPQTPSTAPLSPHDIVVQPDGKILLAATFANTVFRDDTPLMRFLPDGRVDDTFDALPQVFVHELKLQDDGKIVAAGDIRDRRTAYGAGNGLIRLHEDGSEDPTFARSATPSFGRSLALVDGRIYLGGYFEQEDGSRAGAILIKGGNIPPGPPILVAEHSTIDTTIGLAVTLDVIAGGFPTVEFQWARDGVPIPGATGRRLNIPEASAGDAGVYTVTATNAEGSVISAPTTLNVAIPTPDAVDPTFSSDNRGFAVATHTVALSDGGLLTSHPSKALARFTPDGSIDSSFNFEPPGGLFVAMNWEVDGAGRIYVIGRTFPSTNTVRTLLYRLEANGTINTSYGAGGVDGIQLREENGTYPRATTLAIDPQDRAVLAGGIGRIGSEPTRGQIVRLTEEGLIDETFAATVTLPNPYFQSLAFQTDGKLLVSASFWDADSETYRRLIRLNTDGSVDTDFAPNGGPSSSPSSMISLEDGKILIAGFFSHVDKVPAPGIARLMPDGSLDRSFDPGFGPQGNRRGFGTAIQQIVLERDGRILANGTFVRYDGVERQGLVRLNADGSLDTTFGPGITTDGNSKGISLSSTGAIFLSGDFVSVSGTSAYPPVRLFGGTADPAAPVIYREPDDRTVVRGYPVTFTAGASSFAEFSYQWMRDDNTIPGATHRSLRIETVELADAGTYSLAVTNSEGTTTTRMANLTVEEFRPGALDIAFDPPLDPISAPFTQPMTSQSGGRLLAFDVLNPTILRDELFRFLADGSLDSSFLSGNLAGSNSQTISALLVDAADRIIYTENWPQTGRTVHRLLPDGAIDTSFVESQLERVPGAALAGDKVYLAQGSQSIVRLSSNGTVDNGFQIDPDGFFDFQSSVAMAVLRNGDLVTGGYRTRDGQASLARIDEAGAVDADFASNARPSFPPSKIAEQPNGDLVLAGAFREVNNEPLPGLARIKADGTLDTSFVTPRFNRSPAPPSHDDDDDDDDNDVDTGWNPNHRVNTVVTDVDGALYIGGNFRDIDGNRKYAALARILPDGTLDVSFDPGLGIKSDPQSELGPEVHHLFLQEDGSLAVAGAFSSYDGIDRYGLVKVFGVRPGRPVTIPDENLHAAIAEASSAKAALTTADLALLVNLNLAGRSIRTLSGLEHAVNLRTLVLDQNPLTSLSPLATLQQLRGLSLVGITEVDLAPIATLSRLKDVIITAGTGQEGALAGSSIRILKAPQITPGRTLNIASIPLHSVVFDRDLQGTYSTTAIPGVLLSWPEGVRALEASNDLHTWTPLALPPSVWETGGTTFPLENYRQRYYRIAP